MVACSLTVDSISGMRSAGEGVDASSKTAQLPGWLESSQALRSQLCAELARALDDFHKHNGSAPDSDTRLTVLVAWADGMAAAAAEAVQRAKAPPSEGSASGDGWRIPPLPEAAIGAKADGEPPAPAPSSGTSAMFLHICALPPRPQGDTRVLVQGKARHNAAAKSTTWVRERAALEEHLTRGLEEVILHTDAGHLLEGLQTNFSVVAGGSLVTPSEGVLHGTVRQVLLECAEGAGHPTRLAAPSLATLAAWSGAGISSTSRMFLPVTHLLLPADVMSGALQQAQDGPTATAAWAHGSGTLPHELHAQAVATTAAWVQAAEKGEHVTVPHATAGVVHPAGIVHLPAQDGTGGVFLLEPASVAPDADVPSILHDLRSGGQSAVDARARIKYTWVPGTASSPPIMDCFTTVVPPAARGGGVAGKVATAAFTTAAALGAKVRPTCHYLSDTFVPRKLHFMDVLDTLPAPVVEAAKAAAGGAWSPPPPTHPHLSPAQDWPGHLQLTLGLSPFTSLLRAMVDGHITAASAPVRPGPPPPGTTAAAAAASSPA